ncbi:MAG: hypothetical protein U9Q82_10055 [Chloroflexota bacterium]|nr:hypothetical protein [Chloroflexota bacterium]
MNKHDITNAIAQRVDLDLSTPVYVLTGEDVLTVIVEQWLEQGLSAAVVINDDEIKHLFQLVRENELILPWHKAIASALVTNWPEICHFSKHEGTHGEHFYTTTMFWECECVTRFIHPRGQNQCSICGAVANESPDARPDEIVVHEDEFPDELMDYFWTKFAHFVSDDIRFSVIARHKWVAGANISESIGSTPYIRRFTATIRGYQNWRIYQGVMRTNTVDYVFNTVRTIRNRIDAEDDDVFEEPNRYATALDIK